MINPPSCSQSTDSNATFCKACATSRSSTATVSGMVLEAARGLVPNLVEAIYSIIHAVRDDPAVLVCCLVNGRINTSAIASGQP